MADRPRWRPVLPIEAEVWEALRLKEQGECLKELWANDVVRAAVGEGDPAGLYDRIERLFGDSDAEKVRRVGAELFRQLSEMEFIHEPDNHSCHSCGKRNSWHHDDCELRSALDQGEQVFGGSAGDVPPDLGET